MASSIQQRILAACRAAKAEVRRLRVSHPDHMKNLVHEIEEAMEVAFVDPNRAIGTLYAIQDQAAKVADGRL